MTVTEDEDDEVNDDEVDDSGVSVFVLDELF